MKQKHIDFVLYAPIHTVDDFRKAMTRWQESKCIDDECEVIVALRDIRHTHNYAFYERLRHEYWIAKVNGYDV